MTDTQTLEGAVALLRKMLAIHALDFDADVTSESYPGEHHEEAEEQWCRDAAAFFALPSVSPDRPADAPGEGQWELWQCGCGTRNLMEATQCQVCRRKRPPLGSFEPIRVALTSAPAPSSDALRALEKIKRLQYANPDIASAEEAIDAAINIASAALAAEEAPK